MGVNIKLQLYIKMAEKRGFKILSVVPNGGHNDVEVIGPSGITFMAKLAGTPSDSQRGPDNWASGLKRQEANLLAREEQLPMPGSIATTKPTRYGRITELDTPNIYALLKTMGDNLKLVLTRHTPKGRTTGGGWYLNTNRSVASQLHRIPAKTANYFVDNRLVEKLETDGDKTIYVLTSEGINRHRSLMNTIPQEKPEVQPVMPPELKKAITTFIPTRTEVITKLLSPLSDAEIKTVISYGLEMLKDDLTKEFKAATLRLTAVEEVIQCL